MFITPMKVIIILNEGGVKPDNPIIIPSIPVAKNIITKNLTLVGSMYLTTCVKIWHYYKLTVNLMVLHKIIFKLTTGNTLPDTIMSPLMAFIAGNGNNQLKRFLHTDTL